MNDTEEIRHLKCQARKLRKALNVPQHEALEMAAFAGGYSNWAHCLNQQNSPKLPPPILASRPRKYADPMPVGTLVRFKARRSLGFVYKSDGSTVEFYGDWGPMMAAHEEVSVCRDQIGAKDFKPLRLFLPYGKWTCADGSQVLFNRDYCPLWKRDPSGAVSAIDPNTWVEHDDKDEEWIFGDVAPPVYSKKTLALCLAVLRSWNVEGRRPLLLERLPAAIRSGNMNILKGFQYNGRSAA